MISARDFADTYTSFWQIATPTSETLIREANRVREHFAAPIETLTNPQTHSFVADVAFEMLRETYSPLQRSLLQPRRARARIKEIAQHRYAICAQSGSTWAVDVSNRTWVLSEAEALANRMADFFFEREVAVELLYQPRFRGCGIISDSFGDVIAGNTLYEVKTGDRPYRSVDLRQALVYAALNHAARDFTITHLALLNPRLGTFLKFDLESVTDQLAGKAAAELFGDIVHFISADTISV